MISHPVYSIGHRHVRAISGSLFLMNVLLLVVYMYVLYYINWITGSRLSRKKVRFYQLTIRKKKIPTIAIYKYMWLLINKKWWKIPRLNSDCMSIETLPVTLSRFFFYILLRASPIFNLLIMNTWCMRYLIDDGMLNSFVSWNYNLNGQVADVSIS